MGLRSDKPLTNLERDILLSIQKHYPLSGTEVATIYKILESFDMTIKCLDYATYYTVHGPDAARTIKRVIDKFKP